MATSPSPQPPATPDAEITAESLGQRIRAVRQERELTARALAKLAGVTPGFVSQVERGLVMPSIPTLIRIASALGATTSSFFEPEPRPARLVRFNERRVYHHAERGFREAIISSDETNLLELAWSSIHPGGGTGDELFTHGSQAECVLVLHGELEVAVAEERYVVREGDCLSFPGRLPHGCVNRGSETAEVIWVTTPAAY